MTTAAEQVNQFEIPDDYRETMAVIRERAELAQAELQRGSMSGPAMRRHITDGGGNPEMILMLLNLLDDLIAGAPAMQETQQALKAVSEKALWFSDVVKAFINERPGMLAAASANTTAADHCMLGHAEARRDLALALNWSVPNDPGDTTAPRPKPSGGAE